MSNDLEFEQLINKYTDGELTQSECKAKILEHIAWSNSTMFWCHVIRLKSQHDHIGDEIKSNRKHGEL